MNNEHQIPDHVRERLHAKVREVFPQMPEFIPVKPVPPPTVEQSLAFALTDLAKCKARLHRNEGCFAESLMWLQQGNIDRAKQVLIQGWASL